MNHILYGFSALPVLSNSNDLARGIWKSATHDFLLPKEGPNIFTP